jgi:hypothetical protein
MWGFVLHVEFADSICLSATRAVLSAPHLQPHLRRKKSTPGHYICLRLPVSSCSGPAPWLPRLLLTAHFGALSMYVHNIMPEIVPLATKVYSVSKTFSNVLLLHGMAWVRERIISTKLPPLADQVNVNFCRQRVLRVHGQCDGSLRPYSWISRYEEMFPMQSLANESEAMG